MTTMLRAAIMLAVLVGLPAAWVYYGPLPPEAQRVVDRFVAAAKEAIDWEKLAGGSQGSAPVRGAAAGVGGAGLAAGGAPAFEIGGMAAGVGAAAPVERAAPVAEATSPGGSLAERVEPLLVQLRELGVAEYALEPWGGQMYRFHCEMPLAGDAQVTEQFEAIAADPQASVAQVVADVASWHASRSTTMLR